MHRSEVCVTNVNKVCGKYSIALDAQIMKIIFNSIIKLNILSIMFSMSMYINRRANKGVV